MATEAEENTDVLTPRYPKGGTQLQAVIVAAVKPPNSAFRNRKLVSHFESQAPGEEVG